MAKSRKVFAVHPGEILKTEFMEPMGVSAYRTGKGASIFPASTKSFAGTVPSAPTLRFDWESISACPRSFGSTFRMTTT